MSYGPFTKIDVYLKHVGNFFRFYSTFEFHRYILSPYLGDSVRKDSYMKMIDQKLHMKTTILIWSPLDEFIVLGPLNSSNNLAYLVDNDKMQSFIQCCSSSAQMIDNSNVYVYKSEEVVDPDLLNEIFD